MNMVPDLSLEAEFSLANEDKEVLINGARIIFDKKAPLLPVILENEQKKTNDKS
jgi:hypothetical protein